MSFSQWVTSLPISEKRMLELFPPFLFMGVKVLGGDMQKHRWIEVRLPLKWRSKNMHGTMFGGLVCCLSDPLPTLLCERIFEGTLVWTKKQTVHFRRPARTDLDLKVEISEEAILDIQKQLDEKGSAERAFHFQFKDQKQRVIADVENIIFLKKVRS